MYALMACSRVKFIVTLPFFSTSFTVSSTCESEARKQEKYSYVQRPEEVTP
jgi:hypothetical protein